jgi:hypothetical protein
MTGSGAGWYDGGHPHARRTAGDTRTIQRSRAVKVEARTPLSIRSWHVESAGFGVMVFRRDVSFTLGPDGLELLADEAEMTVGTRICHLKGNERLGSSKEGVAKRSGSNAYLSC